MEGDLGLITNPNLGQVILAVILIMALVFLMAAGGVFFEWVGRLFKRSPKTNGKA